jgi:serine protease Do
MKISNWGALACALVLAGVTAPAARAQSPEPLLRAMQVVGRGAHIGVTIRDVEADAKDSKTGVIVEALTPGGPADKAGIKAGDTITEFDGERVRSALQFSRLVSETPESRSVQVVVGRGGQRLTLSVLPERATFDEGFGMRTLQTPSVRLARPAMPPEPPDAPRAPRPPALVSPAMPFDLIGRLRNTARLGATIEDLDTQLAEYFGVKEGVLVKSVAEGSVAAKAGLKAGDVITSVNGRHIYDASDVTRALDRMEDNGDVTLDVSRDRKTQTLKGKLETQEKRTRTRVRTTL